MYKIPITYSQWLYLLDEFKIGIHDDLIIKAMDKGEISWTPDVAERFVQVVFDTLNYRLDLISDRLNRDFSNIHSLEVDLVRAITNARNSIKILKELANVKAFPDELKNQLNESITNFVDSLQNSLIESSRRDRSGRLTVIIKNNAINYFNKENEGRKDYGPMKISKTEIENKKSARRVILS